MKTSAMDIEFLIEEVKRCMVSLMETGEFPSDTCPADIYTLCQEATKLEDTAP